jgi:hypothetical protein
VLFGCLAAATAVKTTYRQLRDLTGACSSEAADSLNRSLKHDNFLGFKFAGTPVGSYFECHPLPSHESVKVTIDPTDMDEQVTALVALNEAIALGLWL